MDTDIGSHMVFCASRKIDPVCTIVLISSDQDFRNVLYSLNIDYNVEIYVCGMSTQFGTLTKKTFGVIELDRLFIGMRYSHI